MLQPGRLYVRFPVMSLDISVDLILPATVWPESTQPVTEMRTRSIAGDKGLLACKAGNLITIWLSRKVWELRCLTALWASISCFTFPFYIFRFGVISPFTLHLPLFYSWELKIIHFIISWLWLVYLFSVFILLAYFQMHINIIRPPLWSSGQISWLQIRRPRVRFPGTTRFSEKKKKKKENM
jgi:hypothetical protein